MLINGVEMKDLDIYDVEVAERYEKALGILEGIEGKIKGLKMSESIRTQCTLIFEFFNTLYGEGADRKIFGESVNLVTCVKALGEFMEQIDSEKQELEKLVNKYSPNRAKRRGK